MTLLNEERISLSQLAQEQDVATTTTWRWISRGVRSVRLESFSIGGRRWTTRQAFARFVQATTQAANSHAANSTPSVTGKQRDAAIKRAEDKLAAAGV
jgi:hypothetical protein